MTARGKIAESKVAKLQTRLKLSAITPVNTRNAKPRPLSQPEFDQLKIYLGYVHSQSESLIVLSTPI